MADGPNGFVIVDSLAAPAAGAAPVPGRCAGRPADASPASAVAAGVRTGRQRRSHAGTVRGGAGRPGPGMAGGPHGGVRWGQREPPARAVPA
ncbi:hypothetical protein G6F68_019411 [Rhizopus microsporus]|nr:hypothetical protein G6F68_019411 [Rhizopus microsporus]